MGRSGRVAWMVALGLALGGVARAGSGKAPRPITRADLAPALERITLRSIRKSQPALSPPAFRAKMKDALRSPEHLKRSFPALLGVMLRPLVGSKALPGRLAPIGFDDHIENTGIVRVGPERKGRSRSIRTIIDFDDAGIGPAGVEALSIGTGLRQAGFAPRVLKKAYKAFAGAATGSDRGPIEVDGPRWDKLRRRWIAENTQREQRDGARVLALKHADRVSPAVRDRIDEAIAREPLFDHQEVLDIAATGKIGGGSGGLLEYRVLTRDTSTDQLRAFLLKESTPPGAAQLGVGQGARASRLATLERGLWNRAPQGVFFNLRGVSLPGQAHPIDFLVRDELAIVGTTDDHARTAVEVAHLYGREHAGQFGSLSAKQLARWMAKSSSAVADAFVELRDKLRAER